MPQQTYGNKKPFLILDTNIIIYQSQTWTEKQFGKELVNLEASYTLSISKITRYEILKSEQIQRESRLLNLLNLFESFEVTEEILIVAALLHRLFKVNQDKHIQDPDTIIAATAFLTKSSILTVNRTDFPSPYYEEKRVSPILYQRTSNKTDCLLLCLLQPNTGFIRKKIEKLF